MTFAPRATQTCFNMLVAQDGMPGEGLEVFSLRVASLSGQSAVESGSLANVNVFINDVPGTCVCVCIPDSLTVIPHRRHLWLLYHLPSDVE